jgi:hypothetical protein
MTAQPQIPPRTAIASIANGIRQGLGGYEQGQIYRQQMGARQALIGQLMGGAHSDAERAMIAMDPQGYFNRVQGPILEKQAMMGYNKQIWDQAVAQLPDSVKNDPKYAPLFAMGAIAPDEGVRALSEFGLLGARNAMELQLDRQKKEQDNSIDNEQMQKAYAERNVPMLKKLGIVTARLNPNTGQIEDYNIQSGKFLTDAGAWDVPANGAAPAGTAAPAAAGGSQPQGAAPGAAPAGAVAAQPTDMGTVRDPKVRRQSQEDAATIQRSLNNYYQIAPENVTPNMGPWQAVQDEVGSISSYFGGNAQVAKQRAALEAQIANTNNQVAADLEGKRGFQKGMMDANNAASPTWNNSPAEYTGKWNGRVSQLVNKYREIQRELGPGNVPDLPAWVQKWAADSGYNPETGTFGPHMLNIPQQPGAAGTPPGTPAPSPSSAAAPSSAPPTPAAPAVAPAPAAPAAQPTGQTAIPPSAVTNPIYTPSRPLPTGNSLAGAEAKGNGPAAFAAAAPTNPIYNGPPVALPPVAPTAADEAAARAAWARNPRGGYHPPQPATTPATPDATPAVPAGAKEVDPKAEGIPDDIMAKLKPGQQVKGPNGQIYWFVGGKLLRVK